MSVAPPAASLFLTTAEMPRHLSLVFAALARQSTRNFEILLCDDGSGPATRSLIDEFRRASGLELRHFWQENLGFRKCKILNRALADARGTTAIFLDGDCVPHRHFIRDHLAMQAPGRYVCGRRINLGPQLSDWLTPTRVSEGFFDRPRWPLLRSVWAGETDHLQRSLRVTWRPLRKLLQMERIPDLLGSNYSVPRADLEAINGFDEEYEGYGREDTDAEIRLQNLGRQIKSIKGMALQFHVWHPRRAFVPANDSRLEEAKRSGRVRCARGLRDLSGAEAAPGPDAAVKETK